MLKIAQKGPKLPCFLSSVYRSQSTGVLTVCQQHAQKVLAHCANSRISASVSTPSVLTVDMSVPTLERGPCATRQVALGAERSARGQVRRDQEVTKN